MRALVLIALVAAAAGGCATLRTAETRSTEATLIAAGFRREPADTPQGRADLHLPPARHVLSETRNGHTLYVYRDPLSCNCRYVGGEPEYQRYRQLRAQRPVADEAWNPAFGMGWRPGRTSQYWGAPQDFGFTWP